MRLRTTIILVLTILLTACSPTFEQSVQSTATTQPTLTPVPTNTQPPTNTPTPTPIPYSALSPNEKLEQSQTLVEAVSQYAGQVTFTYHSTITNLDYPFYWHAGREEWRTLRSLSKGGFPEEELDMTGSTFAPIAIPGYENSDGSLVMIDPFTGAETSFPATVFIPAFGEITLRQLYEMGQDDLGKSLIEMALPAAEQKNEGVVEALRQTIGRTVIMPGFVIKTRGKDEGIFTVPSAINGEDLPETKFTTMYEQRTDNFVIPIFSPETGNFMFFLDLHRGHLASVMEYTWRADGVVSMDWINWFITNFGKPGNEFGILIEWTTRPSGNTWEGGGSAELLENSTGIGNGAHIQQILNARTEEEIIDQINQFRVFVSIPPRVMYPVK